MKKLNIILLGSLLLVGSLTSCGDDAHTITVAASELPHAKILNEAVKPLLAEQGYKLKVSVLDWTLQNDAVAHDEYDANYFQHIPYLNANNLTGDKELVAAAKVHYEKLCLYASDTSDKTLSNGDTIEIVNDVSNIERALLLLASYNILTINDSNYDSDGNFVNFDTNNPNSCVTFTSEYSNCTLTCIQESYLCASLPDYNFGVIPGNTALTGLGDLSSRIVFGEKVSEELIDERSNIIACKKNNVDSPKIIALVEALGDPSVKTYIESTFGESVLYHYVNLLED